MEGTAWAKALRRKPVWLGGQGAGGSNMNWPVQVPQATLGGKKS